MSGSSRHLQRVATACRELLLGDRTGANEATRPSRRIGASDLHADDRGSISLASVFALVLLAYLLGLVMNTTRQADHRIKLQNAADAAAISGGNLMSRTLNSVAFTNHLTSDVLALTAFFREAAEGKSRNLALEALDNWSRIAPHLSGSEFPKFAELGDDIPLKVSVETRMVETYLQWAAAMSESMLPVLETMLQDQLINEFQRDLVDQMPRIIQLAVDEVVARHAQSWPYPGRARAVLWRTAGEPVNGPSETVLRTVPVVDPLRDPTSDPPREIETAREVRDALAHRYLDEWNDESLRAFDRFGKMSCFAQIWRSFTCGELERLLEENAGRNIPIRLREPSEGGAFVLNPVERDFSFVLVVYADPINDRVATLFRNPTIADEIAFSQIQVFVRQPRLRATSIWHGFEQNYWLTDDRHLGGMPRDFAFDMPLQAANRSSRVEQAHYHELIYEWHNWLYGVRREGAHAWDSFSQNWQTQLVPATTDQMSLIISTPPGLPGWQEVRPPNLSLLSADETQRLTQH
ncbi:MAG: hypothetical protein KDA83_17095 [Planctomycetales bacterium]|nr:hypothetical protein [Planctomycetales bacterium]